MASRMCIRTGGSMDGKERGRQGGEKNEMVGHRRHDVGQEKKKYAPSGPRFTPLRVPA